MENLLTEFKALTFMRKLALFFVVGSGIAIFIFIMSINNNQVNDDQLTIPAPETISVEQQLELYELFNRAANYNSRPFGDETILPNNYEAVYRFENGNFTLRRYNDLLYARGPNLEIYFTISGNNLNEVTAIARRGEHWHITNFGEVFNNPEVLMYAPMLEEVLQRTTSAGISIKDDDISVYNTVLAKFLNDNEMDTVFQGLNYTILLAWSNNHLSSIQIDFPMRDSYYNPRGSLFPRVIIEFRNVDTVDRFNVSRDTISQIII